MKISLIAGARPNFMKLAPLVRAFHAIQTEPRIVHTGQHYDEKMSRTFFDELQIPEPHVNLGIGSGSHIWQIAAVMQRLEREFTSHQPEAVVVVGDVNSTLAAALTASKLEIPLAHVEAGLRSFDRTMPEELNRVVVDQLSNWLFASEPSALHNLKREGIPEGRAHFVGNIMIDTLLAHLDIARALQAPQKLDLQKKNYVLLTLHRPSNVDHREKLEAILEAVKHVRRRFPVIFPVHPRTNRRLEDFELKLSDYGIQPIEPQGYHDTLALMENARFVMTDSGGIQEETTALTVPCLTLRENTERPVTVEVGSNRLVGWRTSDIIDAYHQLLNQPEQVGQRPENWDGRTAERIAQILTQSLTQKPLSVPVAS